MNQRRNALGPSLVLCIVLGALVADPSGATNPATGLRNAVPCGEASTKTGQAIYAKYCAFCHGAEAKGDGAVLTGNVRPPNLTDDRWSHGSTDGEIFTIIRDGAGASSAMKPFSAKLPDKDIWHLVNYLRSLGSKKRS